MTSNLMVAITVGVALVSPAVVWFDVREKRIPNRVTAGLGIYALLVALGILVIGDNESRLIQALAMTVITVVSFAGLLWLAPNSIGMGDVKFVVVLAFLMSLASPAIFVYSMLVTALIGGVWGLVQLLRKNLNDFAYGPSIVMGVWVGIIIGFQSAF